MQDLELSSWQDTSLYSAAMQAQSSVSYLCCAILAMAGTFVMFDFLEVIEQNYSAHDPASIRSRMHTSTRSRTRTQLSLALALAPSFHSLSHSHKFSLQGLHGSVQSSWWV